MSLPIYASPIERVWHYTYRVICAVIFVFLIGPIFVIIPLSFNELPYFTFTPEMLSWIPPATAPSGTVSSSPRLPGRTRYGTASSSPSSQR